MTYTNYPYNMYPLNSYTPQPQPAPTLAAQQPQQLGIIWVDGEVGARAYQLPAGWPANTPVPLWDTNDTFIYLKSTNPMGMPNPLQRLPYTVEDTQHPMPERRSATPALMSGEHRDPQYVTRDDLERMKQEIRDSITEAMAGQHAETKKGAKTE